MSIIHDAAMVFAAGLMTPETTQFQVKYLASRLFHDPIVRERALAMGFEPGTCVMLADADDYVEIIQDMTPEEKQAIRERVAR
jgi:hypothetical protein